MAGDMMEARRHIEALFRVIGGVHGAFGAESCEYCASVSDAQAFLTRLDGEGQRVEGGDILPCPFCGTIPTDIDEYDGHYHKVPTFYVNCTACDIAVYAKGRDAAIARWNTRPAELTRLKAEQPDIRNAALEEAARIAENRNVGRVGGFGNDCKRAEAITIAHAIRALISQPNGGQT